MQTMYRRRYSRWSKAIANFTALVCVCVFVLPFVLLYKRRAQRPLFITFAHIGNYGRLGNQIFQVAATIGISHDYGVSWRFPERITNTPVGELFELRGDLDDDLALTLSRHSEGTEIFHRVKVHTKHGQPVSLHGYFQWPQYFEKSHDLIRSVLRVNPKLVAIVQRRFPELVTQKSVAIHVRRGDYVELQHIYNVLGIEYYLKALDYVDFDHVYIVSDDNSWCETELSPRIRSSHTISDFHDELLDFTLLYLSDSLIISSSSFSWWAAFLKEAHFPSENRTIVAPKNRYNSQGDHSYLNLKSYYPTSWKLLD